MAEDVVIPTILGQRFQKLGSEHPVFKTTLNAEDFVLKGDGTANMSEAKMREYFVFAADLFRAVTPGFCEMRMLRPDELAAVKAWPAREESRRKITKTSTPSNAPPRPTAPTPLLPTQVGFPEGDDEVLANVKEPTYVWFIMKFVQNLVSGDSFSSTDKSTINGNANMMVDLGKILVADLFLGSQDRFAFTRKSTKAQKEWEPGVTWSVQNYNNIFIVGGTAPKFVGLDFLDPTSQYNDLSKDIPATDFGWPGWALKSGSQEERDVLADAIADSMNKKLGLALGKTHKEKLRKGITDARETMKKYFSKNKPSLGGVKARLKILGW